MSSRLASVSVLESAKDLHQADGVQGQMHDVQAARRAASHSHACQLRLQRQGRHGGAVYHGAQDRPAAGLICIRDTF